ncbi:dTDP-4-dehydrorhamnose 3,5-epimerase [Aeromonas veronii]|uniref:dTDP-4-dehydrorhamnose 3,5-epimerase n=1 Tax=Aeromonas TaxID=642 RepID=UPI000CCDB352|nr:dTDP-4-dehydrorhamnose 3,5-epimerase [Aeromonas veronii]MBL0446271.1 dTDP-4-dehydrorhamnose 3,5-epimerase [Aeromonas veronii]PNW69079.1 dTDP-4-dehydrorhamnose 3,5-epimerase [Aeromonas veronii]BBT96038.1 dTDP-4-dehydrorhamnose 3,5-epimerase [Aeromonas veronii]
MIFSPTALAEVMVLTPETWSDQRGYFRECFRQSEFEGHCGRHRFVQDNVSHSLGGTLRGLHYQRTHPQGKLVQALSGRIFDVAVDIRPTSASYGHWVGHILDAQSGELMWIPPGFAHGFYVLSASADVFYKCTDYYLPGDEAAIRWDSAQLAITWPLSEQFPLLLSDKDRQAPDFIDMP